MTSATSTNWAIVTDDVAKKWLGTLGTPVTRALNEEHVSALNASLGSALFPEFSSATSLWGMQDICPDPLVFAIGTGLPRLRLLATQIDGGSEWENWAPMGSGAITLVSRIAAIHRRQSASKQVMMRTTYEVTGYTARGAAVGVARGFSLDVGANEGVEVR